MSQQIERINAWTCSNAYACVPFFTHTAHVSGVISLEDWVLELQFSNLRVKFAKSSSSHHQYQNQLLVLLIA